MATTSKVQIALPSLHAGQIYVWNNMQRFTVLNAGRRWRKTSLGARRAITKSLRGARVIWGAPTYKQVDIGWGEVKKAVGGIYTFHSGHMTATSPSGGVIYFRSLDDPDNARGLSGEDIILDEAADIDEEAWTAVLRPMLVDNGGGGLFMGTPKGRNWFWREYEMAVSGGKKDSIAFTAPTRGARVVDGSLIREPHPLENPEIPWEEIVDIFASTPERTFRQEILAEFLESAGGVFKNIRGCVRGQLESGPDHPASQYVMGVDLAKYNDYTVCVVIDPRRRQVVDFQRWNLLDWPLQKAKIATLAAKWNNAVTWLDSTGLGNPIYDDLARAGMRVNAYTLTQISKRELIDNAVLLVEQQQITYPDIATLISELSSYEYERLPGGGLRMNAPSGMHDDAVIAFALACWPLAHTAASIPQEALDMLRTNYTELNMRTLMRRTF